MSLTATVTPPRRRRSRRLLLALAMVAFVAAVLAGIAWYLDWSERRDYAEALAETDRLDPGWRLEDITAARTPIADDRNAAVQALEVCDMFGRTVGINQKYHEQIDALPLNVALNAEQTAELVRYFEDNADARSEARKLKNLPAGRLPSTYDPRAAEMYLTRLQRLRATAHFMQLDLLLAAQENDGSAGDALRANFNNARCIGDEPSLIAHLVRIACLEVSLGGIERALAQTTIPPRELQTLQQMVQEDIDAPRLWQALRGERAIGVETMELIRDGKLERSALGAAKSGWRSWLPGWLTATNTLNRADYVRSMNEIVEAAKLPVEKQLDEMERITDKWRSRGAPGMELPALTKLAAAQTRSQARLRCTLVALAAERYRQEQDIWPESLEALVKAGFLKAVLLDPFDAKPLRCKRLPDGFLIYSVGVDRVDNGGLWDRTNPVGPGMDIGFRLWDRDRRRQRAAPPTLE
jgi:hypothetical protein